MARFEDVYLFADLDGTTLDDDKGVPAANVEALRRFLAEGGKFGVATGRSPHNMNMGLDRELINAPCILCNGAVVYDMEKGEYLHCAYIPRAEAMAAAERVLKLRPKVSLQVCTREALYQVNPSADRWEDPLVPLEGIRVRQSRAEDISGEWIKMVVCAPDEMLCGLQDELGTEGIEGVFNTVRSGDIYFEFLPMGATKGDAVKRFRAMLPQGSRIMAIGDYYNDAEMLKAADISAAPSNAPEDIRDMADYQVRCNNAGALGDFLDRALFAYRP